MDICRFRRRQLRATKQLCNTCAEKNWTENLIDISVERDRPKYDGSLLDLVKRQHCSFCRLVLHLLPSHEASSMLAWAARQPDTVLSEHRYGLVSSMMENNQFSYMVRHRPPGHTKDIEVGEIHVLSRNYKFLERMLPWRILGAALISSRTILSYLRECDKKHSICQERRIESASRDPIRIRLIDVKKGRLVSAQSSCEYIALSYVWGGVDMFKTTKANIDALEQYQGLSVYTEQIPLVILDTMRLVSALRKRYLWVDSLCIVQDDFQEKHSQIQQMEMVYSHASLTIIPITAENADSTIPGVRSGTRSRPRAIETVQGVKLVAHPCCDLTDFADISCYETRGWTYQEKILSPRCLYISERQAFFQCLFTIKAEILDEDQGFANNLYSLNPLAGEYYSPAPDPLNIFPKWYSCVSLYQTLATKYTRRRLSYSSDILSAFAGVIAMLQQRGTMTFAHGLPETFFDIALLWQGGGPGCRRLHGPPTSDAAGQYFPSWSWAGWTTPILGDLWVPNNDKARTPQFSPILRSEIEEFYIDDGTQLRQIPRGAFELVQLPECKSPLKSLGTFHRTATEVGNAVLHFIASTVPASYFNITQEEPNIRKEEIVYRIHQAAGRACGQMELATELDIEQLRADTYDYVLLSRMEDISDHARALNSIEEWWLEPEKPAWDTYVKRNRSGLNIMLIQWKGDVAERVAVGQLHVEAWPKSHEERKYIRLA